MAMKVVVLLSFAMLVVLTEHKAMAAPFCVVGCTTKLFKNPEDLLKCLAGCGPCPSKCIVDFIAKKSQPDVSAFATCITGCLSPFGTISNEVVETLNAKMTVCNVGCSIGLCSKFLNDNNKFGTCMTSCRENHCVGGNIALEKA